MSEPLLAMRGVRFERSNGFRLDVPELTLRAGESLALIGANGAGKSSLLRLVTGDLQAAEGEILLSGERSSALRPHEVARRVAHLRQQPDPAFAASALEVVLHGRWVHLRGLRFPGAADLAKARAALARVDAEALAERDFRSLSGGERQRVLFAKALAQEASLLLLDEPTAGLDLRHGVAVAGLASKEVKQGGLAQLLVTHDLPLAAWSCDRAILLREGSVLAAGTIDEVFQPALLSEAFGHDINVDADPKTGLARPLPRFPSLS